MKVSNKDFLQMNGNLVIFEVKLQRYFYTYRNNGSSGTCKSIYTCCIQLLQGP